MRCDPPACGNHVLCGVVMFVEDVRTIPTNTINDDWLETQPITPRSLATVALPSSGNKSSTVFFACLSYPAKAVQAAAEQTPFAIRSLYGASGTRKRWPSNPQHLHSRPRVSGRQARCRLLRKMDRAGGPCTETTFLELGFVCCLGQVWSGAFKR